MEIANQIWSAAFQQLYSLVFLFLLFFSLCLLQALLSGNAKNNISAHFQPSRIFDHASSAGLILQSYVPSWCRTFFLGLLSTNEK